MILAIHFRNFRTHVFHVLNAVIGKLNIIIYVSYHDSQKWLKTMNARNVNHGVVLVIIMVIIESMFIVLYFNQ